MVRATLMVQGAGSTTGQAPRFFFPRGAWACWNSSSTNDRLSALDGGEFAASAGGGQPKACRYLAERTLLATCGIGHRRVPRASPTCWLGRCRQLGNLITPLPRADDSERLVALCWNCDRELAAAKGSRPLRSRLFCFGRAGARATQVLLIWRFGEILVSCGRWSCGWHSTRVGRRQISGGH